MLKARTWRSNTGRQTIRSIDCGPWRPIWSTSKVDVIVTIGGDNSIQAAKAATTLDVDIIITVTTPAALGLKESDHDDPDRVSERY
jgi:hypothetical protein